MKSTQFAKAKLRAPSSSSVKGETGQSFLIRKIFSVSKIHRMKLTMFKHIHVYMLKHCLMTPNIRIIRKMAQRTFSSCKIETSICSCSSSQLYPGNYPSIVHLDKIDSFRVSWRWNYTTFIFVSILSLNNVQTVYHIILCDRISFFLKLNDILWRICPFNLSKLGFLLLW